MFIINTFEFCASLCQDQHVKVVFLLLLFAWVTLCIVCMVNVTLVLAQEIGELYYKASITTLSQTMVAHYHQTVCYLETTQLYNRHTQTTHI